MKRQIAFCSASGVFIAATLLSLATTHANAAIVSFQARGTVDNVLLDPTLGKIAGAKLGDPFTFTYSFDDTTPNTGITPSSFIYKNALRSLTVDIGSQHFDLNVSSGTSIAGANDDFHPGPPPAGGFFDSYYVALYRTDGNLQTSAGISMGTSGATPPAALTSTALTDTPPSLILFGGGTMSLSFLIPDPTSPLPGMGSQNFVSARITSFARTPTAVPIPGALGLFGIAVGGLGVRRRRTN